MKIIETHIVPAIDEKIRLQEYAVSIFKTIPTRSGVKKAIKRGEILLNGKPAKTANWIAEGQKIELLQPIEGKRKAYRLKLEVLFEDDDLAVVKKPSGIPTSGNYFKTVENALSFNLKKSAKISALAFPLPVHRLDNPTSGLLICAKTRPSLVALQKKFKERKVQKTYIALCSGNVPEKAIFDDDIDEKKALTHIERIKSFHANNQEFSLIKVFPHTGRTHQIRIHLSGKGFSILGDTKYGGIEIQQKKGIFLAAVGLIFHHPFTNEFLNFEIPVPQKFLKAEKYLRRP
ncbi:pseudouridine synthase [Zunongwangia sp. H14]|uniref:RluA family pseudouridine synthase n=1 Tax=Zunongwangia sp. H14 TaxID=3240792 RepID=UPI00356695D6